MRVDQLDGDLIRLRGTMWIGRILRPKTPAPTTRIEDGGSVAADSASGSAVRYCCCIIEVVEEQSYQSHIGLHWI